MIIHMTDEFKTKIINNYANYYLKIIDFIIVNNELNLYAKSFFMFSNEIFYITKILKRNCVSAFLTT